MRNGRPANIEMGADMLNRVAAELYWGRIFDPGLSARIADLATSFSDYERDRGANPVGEDFRISEHPGIFSLYRTQEDFIRETILETANTRPLTPQTPYIARYLPGPRGGLDMHADNSAWTLIWYLNGNFSGGELMFPTLGVSLKPRAGMAVMFPGGVLYPHASAPVAKGCKLAMVIMVDRK
ncbi:2OG-Fe(II) oxygenase [Roseibium marinum]|uniref:2-oxoglutarate-Fe(II)-dependent oxygenase superfamily protein n=1 Tax=Roseibium marinum TaxID=281252 RepID=A0A2S3US64_9HYPH|nr:2OG-Fe(II) oxygenase [Roseibium marinum]POF30526.1 2-oxoglutarate-Fe(II)-dependent oxygenase superfamily protein [Roseibium marinum]